MEHQFKFLGVPINISTNVARKYNNGTELGKLYICVIPEYFTDETFFWNIFIFPEKKSNLLERDAIVKVKSDPINLVFGHLISPPHMCAKVIEKALQKADTELYNTMENYNRLYIEYRLLKEDD
jgi:hypothetical protein